MITICIPSVGRHHVLQEQAQATGCPVLVGQGLGNASETRKKLAKQAETDWILYLDDDILFEQVDWFQAMQEHQKPDTAVFARTIWRKNQNDPSVGPNTHAIDSQCFLVEKKYCDLWDDHLGTQSGVIGGDGESEVFMFELGRKGVTFARSEAVAYHYGITIDDFIGTDRYYLGYVYTILASYKKDKDFFKGIKRFPCDPKNKNNLAEGYSIVDCYKDVVSLHGVVTDIRMA